MPELIEVEVYRRLADRLVGKTVSEVEAPDDWFIKGGSTATQVRDAVVGARIDRTSRRGKLLTMDLGDDRPTLGLRFGMTGRLVLDGDAPIDELVYGSRRDDPVWDRFALVTTDGSRLRISDPRRLGGVELDPNLAQLGPDAWTLTVPELRDALGTSKAPLKARLLDQHRVAGLGNLLVDETLWRVGLAPDRSAGGLGTSEQQRLADGVRQTVSELFDRGGSHRGDLQEQRQRDGRCPTDGHELRRATVGGRTTYWCPHHQR